MSRSLVSSRLTFAAKAGPFVPVAAEGTSETDWLPEQRDLPPMIKRKKSGAVTPHDTLVVQCLQGKG